MLRFIAYLLGLGVLTKLPSEQHRLLYLHGVSLTLFFLVNDQLKVLILGGVIHSLIHNLFPFLTSQGYDKTQLVLPDIFCHFAMMLYGHLIVSQYYQGWSTNVLSLIFILFSIFNCAAAFKLDYNKLIKNQNIEDNFFVITSLSQAISTGYWVAVNLYYADLVKQSTSNFYYAWLFLIGLKTVNWFIYYFNPHFVNFSMKYRYVEGVFIVSSWVGAISYLLF